MIILFQKKGFNFLFYIGKHKDLNKNIIYFLFKYNMDIINENEEKLNDIIEMKERYLKENPEKEKESKQFLEIKELENKLIKEDIKIQKVWSEIKQTKSLLRDNIELTEEIYNKMELGKMNEIHNKKGTFTLKKQPMFIKLFGYEKKEIDINDVKLRIDEINENLSINGDNSSINNSDSEHEFMDLEVQGVCNAKTIETNVL